MKPRVLVLGSFARTAGDDRIGGQAFACRSLVSSALASHYDFVLVDSTLGSIRPGSSLVRLPTATRRFLRCLWHLGPGGAGSALCFASAGASFVEKGCLVLVGAALGRRMVLLPRSGPLVAQVERNRLFRAFVRRVLGRCHRVVCQGESWRRYFLELTGDRRADRYPVIENWLPEEAFVASDADCAASGSSHFVVGYLGRTEAAKGVFDFIEAVCRAHARNPAIRGIVHGDGAALGEVQARLAAPGIAGVVSYGGWLDGADKTAALRRMDAYLFPSHAEGFPNALLEALAQKVPAISTRVGAVVDLIEHGRSGLLVDVGDVAGMAEQLLALAADPALPRRLAEAAYQRVRACNALPSAVERFRELLP